MLALGEPIDSSRYPCRSGWRDAREYRNGWHEGLDFPCPVGRPVFAVDAGKVEISSLSTGVEGQWMRIRHAWGVSRYMHLSERQRFAGMRVNVGDVIGLSGASGIKVSAAHLHFDLALNPAYLAEYVKRFGTPRGGFGKVRGDVTSVPAEPLVPCRLDDKVKTRAEENLVETYRPDLGGVLVAVGFDVATKGGIL